MGVLQCVRGKTGMTFAGLATYRLAVHLQEPVDKVEPGAAGGTDVGAVEHLAEVSRAGHRVWDLHLCFTVRKLDHLFTEDINKIRTE